MNFLRPLFAMYGSGIAGTFGWLFFALSGTPVCASGMEPCRVVVGLAGQLALAWPVLYKLPRWYWATASPCSANGRHSRTAAA